jgi:hypothetical protein
VSQVTLRSVRETWEAATSAAVAIARMYSAIDLFTLADSAAMPTRNLKVASADMCQVLRRMQINESKDNESKDNERGAEEGPREKGPDERQEGSSRCGVEDGGGGGSTDLHSVSRTDASLPRMTCV